MRAQWSCGWRRCCSELPTWSTHLKSCPSLSNRFSNHRKLVSLKLYMLPHWLGEVLNPAPARRHQGKRCHERIWCLSDKKLARTWLDLPVFAAAQHQRIGDVPPLVEKSFL